MTIWAHELLLEWWQTQRPPMVTVTGGHPVSPSSDTGTGSTGELLRGNLAAHTKMLQTPC